MNARRIKYTILSGAVFCLLVCYYFFSVSYVFVNVKDPQKTLIRKIPRPYIQQGEELFLPVMKQLDLVPFLGTYRKRQIWDKNAINAFLEEHSECRPYFPAGNTLPPIFSEKGR